MMIRLRIFTLIFISLFLPIVRTEPCRFTHPTKGTIDISTVGRSDGNAAFQDQSPPGAHDYKYSYNPCYSFSKGLFCIDVAACQISNDGNVGYVLGKQDGAVWDAGAGLGSTPSVTYSFGGKTTRVMLECVSAGVVEFEALGEEPLNTYKFRLRHKCACWNGCGGSPIPPTTTSGGGGVDPSSRTTGGTVFIIILLVLIFVYFVGFAVFYRVRQNRSGPELIAHRTFWVALPGYAKDGVVYIYQRITNRSGDSYNKL